MESTSEVESTTVADKSVCVEDIPENTKAETQSVEEEEGEVTIKNHVEHDITIEENVKEKVEVAELKKSPVQEEIEEVVEDIVEEGDDDNDEVEERSNEDITEEVFHIPDGGQTKTVTTIKKVAPESTKTTVTTSSVAKQKPTGTTAIVETTPKLIVEAVEKPNNEVVLHDKKEENNEHEELKNQEYYGEQPGEEEVEEEENEKEEEKGELFKQEDNEKVVSELKQSDVSSQQQLNKDQVSKEHESQQPTSAKIETAVDAPFVVPQANTHDSNISNKQDNLNNTIKDIISSIDSNIQAEENIAALKERELELLKKQQQLAKEIEQQKLLAQKLANENELKQQFNNNVINQKISLPPSTYQPTTSLSKYATFQEKQDNNLYSRKSEMFESRESTNVSKKIDLHKIFTPATDVEEILPKNRKLYASSAFYSPTLHPTVEDQVELARRISHSLSDISNQQSRGQSMYVNRKKRSVKWVHEGCGQDYHQYQQQPRPSTSPSILPAYTDAAKHRVQLNLHQEQLLEKYAKPGLKVVQTPWEAALNSGSASAAFVEEQKLSTYAASALTPSPTPQIFDASQGGISLQSGPTVPDSYCKTYSSDDYQRFSTHRAPQQQVVQERQQYTITNSQRELAYKPSIPQGWKAPNMSLPKDLYMPKEIPLQSYAPPPVAAIPTSMSPYSSNKVYETNQFSTYNPLNASPILLAGSKSYGGSNTFPVSKQYQQGFSSTYGNIQPPRQQFLPPESYQKASQSSGQNVPQVNFNPSPLPYDKLAKFENQPADDGRYINSHSSRASHLNVRGSKVRNTSPAPFVGSYNRSYTPSSDSHYYGGTPSASPRPLAATQQYSGHNTANLSHRTVASNQILNAPSYNTSARGWGCSGGVSIGHQYPESHISSTRPQILNAASMPYTDF